MNSSIMSNHPCAPCGTVSVIPHDVNASVHSQAMPVTGDIEDNNSSQLGDSSRVRSPEESQLLAPATVEQGSDSFGSFIGPPDQPQLSFSPFNGGVDSKPAGKKRHRVSTPNDEKAQDDSVSSPPVKR